MNFFNTEYLELKKMSKSQPGTNRTYVISTTVHLNATQRFLPQPRQLLSLAKTSVAVDHTECPVLLSPCPLTNQ